MSSAAGRVILAVALVAALALVACGFRSKPRAEASRAVNLAFDGSSVRLLDLRFRGAKLQVVQGDGKYIVIQGDVVVSTTEAEAARLRAESLDLVVQRGGFTRLSLPDAGEGFDYTANLQITLPRHLNLNAVIGEGSIDATFELPIKTDLQLGTGVIKLHLPPATAAFVSAQCNLGTVEVKGFDQVRGESIKQLSSQTFDGQIGNPVNILGNQLEARMNEGTIEILGETPKPPAQ